MVLGKLVYVCNDVDYCRGIYYIDYVVRTIKDGLKVVTEKYKTQEPALQRINILMKEVEK